MDIIVIVENAPSKSQRALIYHLEGARGFRFKESVPLDLRKASSSHAVRRCRRFRCVLNRTNNDPPEHFPTLGNRGGPVFAFVLKNTLRMLDLGGLGLILVEKFSIRLPYSGPERAKIF